MKKHLCVIAYACEPNKGSEPEVGWRWSLALAGFADVTVITRSNNRSAIENELHNIGDLAIAFEYVDLPKWASWWKKGGRFVHLYYVLWQVMAVVRACRVHFLRRCDAVLHVTFSPYYHSPLAALLPMKFIWGPVGAGERLPSSFLPLFSRRQRARETLRTAARLLSRVDPTLAFCCVRATRIIAATRETRDFLPRASKSKTVVEGQLGETLRLRHKERKVGDVYTVVTSGRQEYWKGHIIVLRAFHKFVQDCGIENAQLIVLSDGSENERLRSYVRENGLSDRVVFPGWLKSRDDTFSYLASGDVYAYASLFECGGYVVVEAMSCGTPVVCLDLGGPGEVVSDDCGIRVPAHNPEQAIADMAVAFRRLYEDGELRGQLAQGAVDKVATWFDWREKQERIRRIVDDALDGARSGGHGPCA